MRVLPPTRLLEARTPHATFRDDVLSGLSQQPKRLPCKYFYDRRGSMLFDAICAQPEYYLTRCEQEIMQRYSGAIARDLGRRALLVEFGSGSSIKTRYLLQQLERPAAYVPVDISREHLLSAASSLHRDFPALRILPVGADFTGEFGLPKLTGQAARRVVYFPGSTIGNFEPTGTLRLLKRIAHLVGPGGGLLIGIDLVKEPEVIEQAYNDRAGVTAEFNLNLLLRINRELGGEFDLDEFEHLAFYDPRFERVDIRLVSKREQDVSVNGISFHFEANEAIHTEYSHKYRIDRFARLAREAGFGLRQWWSDERQYFAVLSFRNVGFQTMASLQWLLAKKP